MDDILTTEPNPEETKRLKAALSEIFAQVERIDERIARDQQETERLRKDTRKILAQLKGQ